ncbi:MAG: response regulator transcription factor [Oscillospiraceae bacterium]|nr:response regulator transcription factor [Oscillospiraceae bacterium]
MNDRILVLDPVGSGLQHLIRLPVWEECGFEIAGRTDEPDSAVRTMLRRTFDLLLCIHRPSGETTVQVLSRLHRKAPEIPVLVISTGDDSACMRQCFLFGAVDFLIEPLGDETLREVLLRLSPLLDRRIMNEEYAQALHLSLTALQEHDAPAPLLEKLSVLLEKCQDTAVTTEIAAEFFGFNRDYFTRYFKRRTGMTFSEFHRGFMIEYAKLLLSSGHFKVQEVSDILGLSSADYFTRIFKKHTGKTPSEFKRL